MKRSKKLCSLFLLLSIIMATAGVIPVAADEMGSVDAKEKQKIVAVIYDDSGSMDFKEESGTYQGKQIRVPAAKYALGTLISLIGEEDIMTIIPMNGVIPATYEQGLTVFSDKNTAELQVNLSGANQSADYRNKLVESIISNDLLKPNTYKNTPSASLTRSIRFLEREGLQNSANLTTMDPNKEYWLVILTDGVFNYDLRGNRKNSPTLNEQISYLSEALGDYPTLHTMYVSFGSGAFDLTSSIKNNSVLSKLKLDSFCKVEPGASGDGKDLVSVLQTISNDISGRYPIKNTGSTEYYKVEGNTLTVNLA